MKSKYSASLNDAGNIVQSCIHCHQIGDARREHYRAQSKPIPEEVLFPFPHPKSVGLKLDAKTRATVVTVTEESPAAKAGFQTGDRILAMEGQPLLSMADVQWILDGVPAVGGIISVEIERAGEQRKLKLILDDGWRRRGDISWRVSTWGLRRMASGGLKLNPVSPEKRAERGLSAARMALEVTHVGAYGPHAAAKKAGFRMGDIIISFDEKADLLQEVDVLRYGVTRKKPGETVPVIVLRDGNQIELILTMQK